MNPTTPTSNTAGAGGPYNGGAPLTAAQIATLRSSAGINSNPNTSTATLPVDQRLAQLKAGTYGKGSIPSTTVPQSSGAPGTQFGNDGEIGNGIVDAVKKGASSVESDITNIKPNADAAGGGAVADTLSTLGAAGHVAGDVAGTAGGILGSVLSPFIPTGIKNAVGDAAKYVEDKVNSIPGMTPEIAHGLADVFNTTSLLGGDKAASNENVAKAGTAVESGANTVSDAAGGAGEVPGKLFRKAFTPLPPAIKNTASTAEDAEAATNFVKEAQSASKEAQKGTGSLTHPQMTGESLFGDEGKVTKALTDAKKAAGTKMGSALDAVGDAKVDAKDVLAKHDDFVKSSNLERRVATLSTSQRNLYNQFKDSLYELRQKGGATLKQTDQFLREWQGRNAEDPTLNKAITNTTHDINEAAKDAADKAEKDAGIEGKQYRTSNDEYRQVITPLNQIKDIQSSGYKSGLTGANSANSSLMEQLTSQGGNSKGLMDDVRRIVGDKGKVGGLSMNDQAQLSQFIHDIYTGVNPKTALSKMSVSISPVMSTIRTGMRTLGANATSPDALVARILDELQKAK